MIGRRCIARHCDARFKPLAFVGLILHRNPDRHRLQALEPSGGFKVRALLAAVQRRSALGTLALPIDVRRQGCRTIETPGCHYVLEQARKARARDVDRRAGTGGPGPVGILAIPAVAISVVV